VKLVVSQEEQDLAAMLRDLLAKECPTDLVRRLAEPGEERFPAALWDALVSAGVLGLAFAEEYGGAGGTLDDLGVVAVEAGRALCPTVVSSTLAFGLALDRLGTDDQRSRYLTRLCAGDLRASVALWNPSDAGDLRPVLEATRASGDEAGSDWVVSGTLEFVPDADLAEVLLASAGADNVGGPSAVIGLIVDTSAPGVRVEPVATMGGDRFSRVVLDGVRVPAESALTGPAGAGLDGDDLRRVAHIVSALHCLDLVGVGEAVLRRTVEYTSGRHQFGRPIGSFQAAQHLVADMHIALQAARLASRSAVFWLGRGRVATRETAVARMHATTAAKRITLDAHQLHGGMGYVLETDLHLWSERARVLASAGGTADTGAGWLEKELSLD
jgi:alkylation response protein AidB-like acyl-CoA dehydrogenase